MGLEVYGSGMSPSTPQPQICCKIEITLLQKFQWKKTILWQPTSTTWCLELHQSSPPLRPQFVNQSWALCTLACFLVHKHQKFWGTISDFGHASSKDGVKLDCVFGRQY